MHTDEYECWRNKKKIVFGIVQFGQIEGQSPMANNRAVVILVISSGTWCKQTEARFLSLATTKAVRGTGQ